ncbi:LOG family protein [Sinomonas notoginsengisoli]|uniref:LOG family protein n=1 Tax=Sinomonas notoginsengisoli TaxID=1457311 RepID=UPI001F26FAB8|nr:Rossmann fold nucleotide-binding protein [Sinomonas notoginsengisoli]
MNAIPALGPTPRTLEVESLGDFDALVAGGASEMAGWHLQSLDLTERSTVLKALDPSGAMFLGCHLQEGMEQSLRARGALVFPILPGLPFNPYRPALYTGPELYEGVTARPYEATPDALIYAWTKSQGPAGIESAISAALHDHHIGEALQEALTGPFAGRKIVGIMGGHTARRGGAAYDDAARLARGIAAAGHLVATGGGPGAMEAANLGAYLSAFDEGELEAALREIAIVPVFRPSVSAWARAALAVLGKRPGGTWNLGVPTWFYGHEPPNMFATHIAKYFANSVREAVLLQKCTGGVVFLPGAAGTVQEVFQDACENYYGAAETITPMVLVGVKHWTEDLPAWPLLRSLAEGRGMAESLHLVDSAEEAIAALG